MDYKSLNDYELLDYAVNDANEDASELLYQKYQPVIIGFAKKMLPYCENGGLELNDLIQEGMLGLNNAMIHFNEQKDITFYTFACTCIKRKIISAAISTRRLKHKALNESIPFEMSGQDQNLISLDYILKDTTTDPEYVLLNSERNQILSHLIKDQLTDFELQVFELKMNHFSYDEIASILDRNKKAVDNALQRIKSKMRQILKELD